MNCNAFVPLLGEATEGDSLARVLAGLQRSTSELSAKEIRSEGFASLLFENQGVELIFRERAAFERKYSAAKGKGVAVLASVTVYPNGNPDFRPYEGPAPFGALSIHDRKAALQQFGAPSTTEEDEFVRWDQWLREGLQLRATYDKHAKVRKISVSVPMKQ